MKNYYLLLVFLVSVSSSWSQEYRQMIAQGTFTVQEIQQSAEAYFNEVGTERGKGYKPYKRWEFQALQNMDENGMLPTPEFYFNELANYNSYLNQNYGEARTAVGTWQPLGPDYWNQTSGWNPGVGRVTSIAVEPANPNHIIVGANTGGVWKSTDGGANWITLTDNLSTLNVSALTMDPTNSSTYFWGSSSGVIFRSTDSGTTWDFYSDTGSGTVNKILIDPTNTDKMYASVEGGGIYKSTDVGLTWTRIDNSATNGYDIEFKPGDTDTIYASGSRFYISTDGGATFGLVNTFSSNPKMIGVSANNPNVVYVLEASSGIFGGLYRSVDSGSTFTELNHTGKNYFGYSSFADDNSGQAPRDMDIVVNPQNALDVHIAGVLSWRSIDGGTNFNITSQWVPQNASGQGIGYCHADIDIMEYIGNDNDGYKLYVGSDGGIFVADDPLNVSSSYYRDLTPGLSIRQFYRIGISQTDPVVVSGGSQDNGTSVLGSDGVWRDWLGADGMETFVDKDNSSIIYGTSQFGSLYKSVTEGNNSSGIFPPEGKSGNWITPFEQDPTQQNVIYTGYDEVYKSVNGGNDWVSISQNFGSNLNHLKIASNSLTMYAARGSNLYKTGSGGLIGSWIQLSGFSGSINSIAIHPSDPEKIAIATTGSAKVYVSINGGTSWESYSLNLPNFSARALVWEDNGNDGLYLGMNYGVFYIDNTFTEWQPFSNNLPNVNISELEINTADNKLYAATYGRGLWSSDLFDDSLSLKDFELNSVAMFPNPAKNQVSLSWSKSEQVTIKVYNSLGKLMFYTKGQNLFEPLNIDTSKYNSGLYFVSINTINGMVTKKLIIE